jgi:hypothetical protein
VVIIEGGTPRTVGTTSEKIALVDVAGRPALRRVQTLESSEFGNRRSETTVFRESFLPHTHLDVTEEHTLTILYQGTRITGERRTVDGRVIPIRTDVSSPVFDAHSVEMVLRILPLTDGYVAELPVFHAHRGKEIRVTVHVFGREPMARSGDAVKTWKVKTEWVGVTQYYWIGVESRGLLRQRSELSEGAQLEFVR